MHRFNPAHLDRLLRPERRQWQDPDAIFATLGLRSGMVVADVGSGPGFFTLPAATLVGSAGRVYAVDVEPQMLERVRERANEAKLGNVETLVSTDETVPVPGSSADLALLSNVLHECTQPVALLRDIARALRPEGSLALIEWRKKTTEVGPPVEERLAEEDARELLRQAGFGEIEPFPVGPHHYGLRARVGK